ncbi:hypothetical protein [Xanthomonas melonis]|uniref:hypothetical protein n=1 Tax=Xanthomonas melonis TaxID=56456 RepID=UPI001E528626|nr:hypothetical protein [Xanthomonas melonis]
MRSRPPSPKRADAGQKDLAFGVTLQQIDQFHALLRTIAAQSDMVAVCGRTALDAASVPVLGEGIFTAARALRRIVDEIHEQRLSR